METALQLGKTTLLKDDIMYDVSQKLYALEKMTKDSIDVQLGNLTVN